MYDELVKMLRVCGDSNNSCGNCPARENDGSCPHGEWEFAAEKYMLQAADVRPVVRGVWAKNGWSIRCSICGYDMPFATRNFCPNCGADMREES